MSHRAKDSFSSKIIPVVLIGSFFMIMCETVVEQPPLFSEVAPEQSGLNFSNVLSENDSFNIIQYLYFYNGGGVAAGDLNNDGWPDLYLTANQLPNALYLNSGKTDESHPRFIDASDEAGVTGQGNWSTGVTFVDVNADGWLDIYVCQVGGFKNFQGRNQLFINQGCKSQDGEICVPTFQDEAIIYGLAAEGFSTQASFFDYDRDGDLDMYLLSHTVHSSATYRDTSYTRRRDPLYGDKLFQNRLGEVSEDEPLFVDVSERAGILSNIAGYGLGISVGDLDQNGYPDIYIGNDFHENDFVYLNQGDGTFKEVGTIALGQTSYFSMGNAVADLDNDGRLDIFTLDMKPDDERIFKSSQGPDPYDIYQFKRSFGYHHQYPRNALHLQAGRAKDGIPRFMDVAQINQIAATDWSWGPVIADFDLDGWKDIFITNGIKRRPNDLDYLQFIANKEIQENAGDLELASRMPSGAMNNRFLHNLRQGRFAFQDNWHDGSASLSQGAASADFDLDGDLDLVINNINAPATFYLNDAVGRGNNYCSIILIGSGSNSQGIASKLRLWQQDKLQYAEVYPANGWQSSSDAMVNFGLGEVQRIDSLQIVWPDQQQTVLRDLPANTIHKIAYDKVAKNRMTQNQFSPVKFRNIDDRLTQPFIHRENGYSDNLQEPLIPYLLSAEGPALAIGDINNDQLDDVIVSGAKGQPSACFVQDSSGILQFKDQAVLTQDSLAEDVAMALFDADGDADLDLFIGRGGNEANQHPTIIDRLYLNDGSGNFQRTDINLPEYYSHTSVVLPFDADQDGDLDIFIGNRSLALNYGRAGTSHLLLNDGQANFTMAGSDIFDGELLGMVTDAEALDIDGDGDQDLVVIGEWMSIMVYRNSGRSFQKEDLSVSGSANMLRGWWQSLEVGDLDEDGDDDLVFGNFGLNSTLQPKNDTPVKLYIADFDRNFKPDPILTYFRNDIEYPVMGLMALGQQMNVLKKNFRSHQDFAKASITDVFPAAELEKAMQLQVNNFAHMVAINDGSGNFSIQPLPWIVQSAPIKAMVLHDFDQDGFTDIVMGGNWSEIQPVIEGMHASYGFYLKGDGSGNFQHIPNWGHGLFIDGQVRDLAMARLGRQQVLVVGRNNDHLQLFTCLP